MANKNTISIQLTVKDDGSITMKQFGKTTEEAMNKAGNAATKATGSFNSLKSSYLEFTAKAASAYIAISKAMEYMDMAVKAEQAEESFRTLAAASGESADKIIANMKRAVNSTIDDSELMQKAVKAMLLEFNGDQITKMAEMARMGARSSGEDAAAVYERIVDAISTNMPRALKQYGLITKEQMDLISKAMTEGAKGVDLYSLAVENMAAQQAKMGPLFENDAERLQQYRAKIDDLQESFGKFLTVLAGEAIDIVPAFGDLFFKADPAPLIDYAQKLMGISEASEKAAEISKTIGHEERMRIENDSFAAQKLAEETARKEMDLIRQRAQTSIQAAQSEISNLTTRLDEYQTYYDSLKAMMDKNAEDEKNHIAELNAIQQQRVDNQKLAASLIAGMDGSTKNMSAQQTYESGRSALNQQYSNALNQNGTNQLKALEDYMRAVSALQKQFENGVQGSSDIAGNAVSAAKVLEDAISDINSAERMRETTLISLAAAQQQQISADQQWTQTLQLEAQKTQAELEKIKNLIISISDQIRNMEKTITLIGDDQVTPVIDSIITRIEQLREEARKPIMLSTSSFGSSSPSTGPGLNLNAGLNLDPLRLDVPRLATGTDYIPYTGLYNLHKGEAVIPAEQNRSGRGGVVINGGINLQLPAGAAPQRPEDWRMITRNYIVPELRKLSS